MIAIQNQKKELQEQFHKFIEQTQAKPVQVQLFPMFQYMEHDLKKSFKLFKKVPKKYVRTEFVEFWKELSINEQINYYCKLIELLKLAVQHKRPSPPIQYQGEVFYRKSIISNWQKRKLRLTAQIFLVTSHKKNKLFDLKNYALRKSKNKDFFGWVLQIVQKTDQKSINFGVSNIEDFQKWYKAFDRNLSYLKTQQFDRAVIINQKTHQVLQMKPPLLIQSHSMKQVITHKEEEQLSESINDTPRSEKIGNATLTQLALHNEMKVLDDRVQFQVQAAKRNSFVGTNTQYQYHPNIFSRLMPGYSLDNFLQASPDANLLQFQDQFRICQQPSDQFMDIKIKMIMVLPYPKSLVFNAITNAPQQWNAQIDIFNIKTAIKSQNAAIIYEKHKPQGILYRQRDFLYLRHCFCLQSAEKSTKQQKTFTYIIDKSIDSVNFPPFMTVARGQKLIIYCIVSSENDKQSLLTIQGFVKGGGYMNQAQNKQMTIKQFKNFLQLEKYLKQKAIIVNTTQQNYFFEQNWKTVFKIQQKSQVFEEDKRKRQSGSSKKITVIDHQKEKQLEEFLTKSAEHHQQYKQQHDRASSSQLLVQQYKPPPINPQTQQIIIPYDFLKMKHQLIPKPKSQKPLLFPHFRGHHLYQGQWQLCQNGGLTYVDQEKMRQQRKVLTYIIKRIGRNILSGKGILNISLPVDIFCRQSNIQRLAMSYGYCPVFLQKAAAIQSEEQQLKYVVCASIASSLIYLTFQKPFNPILGQTYQCWIDGCPVYFEQISHHPPIASFLMKGRGYQISGSFQAKMQLSINSGKGMNEGITTVKFDNGNTFYYILAGGQLSGLTYGPRKLNFVGKATYWTKTGLFCQIIYNPASKNKKFFGSGPSYTAQQKLCDYVEGFVKRYQVKDIQQIIYTKKNNLMERSMVIPKGPPNAKPIKELYKINGRSTQYLKCDGVKLFDVDETRYYKCYDQPNPLPSHSNYRQDIVYRRLNDVVKSQNWKQKLEVFQRNDRKFRQQKDKKR